MSDGVVAILAGPSRAGALAPIQMAFLEAIAPDGAIVRSGFPYDPSVREALAPSPLAAAALANARCYAAARWSAAFAARARESLNALLRGRDRAVLISGSAGLAMLNAAWAHLTRREAISVLSFGPAGRAIEDARFVAVQGNRDPWSRALYRGPVHHRIDCAHMGYWESEEARAIARAFVAEALA
ncbi:MAG: hypothetical protein AB7J28_09770 [Hyphomonadaceae bacterium]